MFTGMSCDLCDSILVLIQVVKDTYLQVAITHRNSNTVDGPLPSSFACSQTKLYAMYVTDL